MKRRKFISVLACICAFLPIPIACKIRRGWTPLNPIKLKFASDIEVGMVFFGEGKPWKITRTAPLWFLWEGQEVENPRLNKHFAKPLFSTKELSPALATLKFNDQGEVLCCFSDQDVKEMEFYKSYA